MKLQSKQLKAFEILSSGKYKDVCFYGSGRSGKTFLVCYFILKRALQYPGSYHLFIRSTYTSLLAGVFSQTIPTVINALKKHPGIDLVGSGLIKSRQNPAEIQFENGSSIRFLGLDTQTTNAQATDKILSQEYLTACFEEANEINFEVVEKVKTRLAQKIEGAKPLSIFTLNPTTFDSWDYQYFEKKTNPKSKELVSNPDQLMSMHFSVMDNLNNISEDYVENLKNLSPAQRRRFLEGVYGENYEGEIFTELHYSELPDIREFEKMLIYTDPSYKSGSKNDYKASVLIGLRRGAFWVIMVEAMQCTTSQMILNVHNLFKYVQSKGWQASLPCWFENAGMPDDFTEAIQNYAEQTQWVCPYKLDSRQKGDKYARIESALVPLNEQGKLYFNLEMKTLRVGNLVNSQFLNFKKNLNASEHDDIPDAVHGGITLMNIVQLQPFGISQVKRNMIKLG
jgi:PBSX family phage terminase large subunit